MKSSGGGAGDEVSPKCDNLQSPLTSILPGPGLMSSQPMERNTVPPPPPSPPPSAVALIIAVVLLI